MKQVLKKTGCLLVVLSMLLAYVPAEAFAFSLPTGKPTLMKTETVIIPAAMDSDQRIRTVEIATLRVDYVPLAEEEYLTDPAAAGAVLREAMEKRLPTATVLYEADAALSFKEVVAAIRDAAMAHTGQPTEGDYIIWQRGSIDANGSYYPRGTTNQYTIEFTIEYYTTPEQEAWMDTAVAELLGSLSLDGKTDYEKLCAVYDWMCANITYDYANLEDDTYDLKYTAYAALHDRTSVCQGYAVLLYRLMLELGIDCRVITGLGNGGAHAWNIIELGELYYNADATWDASWYQADLDYNFFLRADDTFEDHVRDANYATEEFYIQYPMSQTDYVPDAVCAHSYTSVVTYPTCTENGYTTYTCTECGDSYTETLWATGHLSVHLENQRDATCGAEGYSGDVVCDTCNQIVEYGYTIWPTGAHNYDSQVTTEAGCETNGVLTYTCTVCGYSYMETIWATGHYYDSVVTDSTCIEQGYTTYTCAYCGDVYVDSYTDALGHNYTYVETPPTCTEDGSRTYTCHCGDTYTEVIPTVPHNFVDGACADCGAAEVQLGDVNRDGRVNVRDARILLLYVVGLTEESEVDMTAADFNDDGRVNVRDARAILSSIAGLV